MPRIFCFALWLGLLSSTSFAQLGALDELYGEGVHRYFANNLMSADQILTQVIDGGSQDPRAYYFRGLARERQGMGGEIDFETGARLEAEGKRVVDVGNALARVQGSERTKIERARLNARLHVKQQQLLLQQARQLKNEAAASQVAPATASGVSPFPTDSIPANETGLAPLNPPAAATQPAAPAITAADTSDPFGDEAAPAEAAAPATGDDPFGAPATEAPATEAPAVDDPFGAPTVDATDNPFGL
jgi:hypothetical protein